MLRRLVELARRHSLTPYRAVGLGYLGEILVRRGEVAHGLRLLRECLEPAPVNEYRIHNTGFTSSLAEALAMTGRPDEALSIIDEAIGMVEADGDSFMKPELFRIKGDIMALKSAKGAEDCLFEAMQFARRQGALSWELRASISLARLLQSEGRWHDARCVLASVYDQFHEGAETSDIVAARDLLDHLSQSEDAIGSDGLVL